MNIVVLCGSYYPYMNPPASCLDKYIQELKKQHCIDVIAPSTHIDDKSFNDSNIALHYISNTRNSIKAHCRSHIEKNEHAKIYKLIQIAALAYGRFLSYFTYPTRESWMIKKYLRELDNINRQHTIDAIISVSFPVCPHFAAYKYKMGHPEIKWITYSTDPFALNDNASFNYSFFKGARKRKNLQWEEKYLKAADFNIFTEELIKASIQSFSLNPNKCVAFPFTLNPSITTESKDLLHTSPPKVVYAGNLYAKIRNPKKILDVMASVGEVDTYLFQAGDCDAILSDYNKRDNIHVSALLPRDEYLHLVNDEADIHINIGNTVSLQAPSKMVQLISTGKPILNFYSVWDVQCDMIDKYPLGLNIGPDDNDIDKVRSFCLDNYHKSISYQEIKELYPENIFEKQMDILNRVLNA